MRNGAWLLLSCLCACGGGGGEATVAPLAGEAQVDAPPVQLEGSFGDLTVSLASTRAVALMQVEVALPPQLQLSANGRLAPARPVATLDGDFVDGRFVVICGDAQSRSPQPLPDGPLFRLRLVPTSPRQSGTWIVELHHLTASTADGQALAVSTSPVRVAVTIP